MKPNESANVIIICQGNKIVKKKKKEKKVFLGFYYLFIYCQYIIQKYIKYVYILIN